MSSKRARCLTRRAMSPASALSLVGSRQPSIANAMRAPQITARPGKFGRMWLKLRVHLDAARRAPRAYLTALLSRFRGKRLRARAQFAPLLGLSPLAYRLWQVSDASGDTIPDIDDINRTGPTFVALIDVATSRAGLDQTLRSLAAEGVPALCVGRSAGTTMADAAQQIDWSSGPWLMPITAGDVLANGAANAYRHAAAGATTQIIYADDDLLDAVGRRAVPHFKPDWNDELFRHFDYLTGACIVRADPADFETTAGDTAMANLVTSAIRGGDPIHVRQVLHHRRTRPRPRILAALDLTGVSLPPVSVIIPTRNRHDLLETCLRGLARTEYPEFEVIVVDNDSDDPATLAYFAGLDPARYRILRHRGAFNFSEINNRAVDAANGRLLCLLNNDVEMLEPGWLATLARQAQRDDVGAVGARLLYPDGRVQHAGVILGVGGAAAHAHRLLHPKEEGYFRRHALPQFVSAVTGACLVVLRDRFLAVGGFDAHNFAVAFNDVDLCLRLNSRGWRTLYEPRATLIHHESVSRGFDRDPVDAARLVAEVAALKALWGTGDMVDPFHHPALSPFSERFVLRV